MVSLPTYLKYASDCDDGAKGGVKCDEAELLMNDEIGENVDPYALDFPVCTRNLSSSSEDASFFDFINYGEKFWFIKKVLHDALHRPVPPLYRNMIDQFEKEMARVGIYDQESAKYSKLFKEYISEMKLLSANNYFGSSSSETTSQPFNGFPPENYHACESNWMTVYLNEKDVQNAIHAKNNTEWTMCSFTIDYNGTDSEVPMEPYYNWLVKNNPDLHITVISGDDDSVCGTLGTQSWMWNMNWTVNHDYNWNAWYVNNQVAGFHTKWTNNVNFVTVHSAGHMIPETQPEKSLEAFKKYLAGSF